MSILNKMLNFCTIFAIVISCGTDHVSICKTEPMKVEFTTLASPLENQNCGNPPNFHIKLEGPGTGTLLGDFDFYAQVCVDQSGAKPVTFNEPDKCIFTLKNGEELYGIIVDGRFKPTSEPGFAEMNAEFKIIGGTGKYKEAAGGGYVYIKLNQSNGTATNTWSGSVTIME